MLLKRESGYVWDEKKRWSAPDGVMSLRWSIIFLSVEVKWRTSRNLLLGDLEYK